MHNTRELCEIIIFLKTNRKESETAMRHFSNEYTVEGEKWTGSIALKIGLQNVLEFLFRMTKPAHKIQNMSFQSPFLLVIFTLCIQFIYLNPPRGAGSPSDCMFSSRPVRTDRTNSRKKKKTISRSLTICESDSPTTDSITIVVQYPSCGGQREDLMLLPSTQNGERGGRVGAFPFRRPCWYEETKKRAASWQKTVSASGF